MKVSNQRWIFLLLRYQKDSLFRTRSSPTFSQSQIAPQAKASLPPNPAAVPTSITLSCFIVGTPPKACSSLVKTFHSLQASVRDQTSKRHFIRTDATPCGRTFGPKNPKTLKLLTLLRSMDTSISLLSIAAISSIASCSDTSVANGRGSRPLVAVITLGSFTPGPCWLAMSPNRGETGGEDGLSSRHWSAMILGDVGLGEAKISSWLFGFREKVASWGLFERSRD